MFNIIINEDGTLVLTVHDIFITTNNKNPICCNRREKGVSSKQTEISEYIYIAQLEIQIN